MQHALNQSRIQVAPVRRLCESTNGVSIYVKAVSVDGGLKLSYEVDIPELNLTGLSEPVARDIANQMNALIRRAKREGRTE